ncbi:MAG: tetratricopeptide repeat protein, partial [Planctomycetota bacterium]
MHKNMVSLVVLSFVLMVRDSSLFAETVAECQAFLNSGRYEDCLAATTTAIEARSYGEEWPILKAQAEIALGKYPEALQTIEAGIQRYNWSVRLRQMEFEAALANGKREQAADALAEIEKLVSASSWRYTDADDMASLGAAALALGVDAKAVQEGFYERARRNYPTRPEGFVAAGRLALEKGDNSFAAELLNPAARQFPENAEVLFLLSEALSTADREQAVVLLQKSLEVNPQYFPALLKVAERAFDGEDYAAAIQTLDQIFAVNPHHPEAHAMMSAIHHVRNQSDLAIVSRDAALKFSVADPRVDFLIGRKLSQKYRFREGAGFQRRAIEADSNFVPAKIQLAQDLLRLGEEAEGWKLAEEAHEKDGYDTNLFNLLQLKDSLDRFTTVSSEHFQVRMEKQEAAVYGTQVTSLLERAWQEATSRYEFTPETPVIVEIYPRADDFAVRTFGMPDVAGFLGVCFGRVITANSPASRRTQPTNWESILWHEFFHVVTLQKTGNKIPRWLSEGISVFEERRIDRRWGQRMDASFRDRVLAGKVTPIAELSSAFLNAKNGEDMNFAYYESSMVVEHIATVHGLPALNAILGDLNSGMQINDSLDRHTGGLEALQKSFAAFLAEQAQVYAPEASFDPSVMKDVPLATLQEIDAFLAEHPNHVPVMLMKAGLLLGNAQWNDAEVLLRSLIALAPDDDSLNGPRRLLASLYQKTNQPDLEAATLEEHLQANADDLEAMLRLQELLDARVDHERVMQLGAAIAAVDPFQISSIQRTLAAADALQRKDVTVTQLQRLLVLQPDDAPRLHYLIARQLIESSPADARRHVL